MFLLVSVHVLGVRELDVPERPHADGLHVDGGGLEGRRHAHLARGGQRRRRR